MTNFRSTRNNGGWSEGGWSERDLALLRQLVGLELPMGFIARRLGKSEAGVRIQAQQMVLAAMGCESLARSYSR